MTEDTQIRTFIEKEFIRTSGLDLQNTDSLIEHGIIDSLGIMKLLTYLEQSFGIKVNDEELIPVNFETIDSISTFIRSKRGGKSAASM